MFGLDLILQPYTDVVMLRNILTSWKWIAIWVQWSLHHFTAQISCQTFQSWIQFGFPISVWLILDRVSRVKWELWWLTNGRLVCRRGRISLVCMFHLLKCTGRHVRVMDAPRLPYQTSSQGKLTNEPKERVQWQKNVFVSDLNRNPWLN